MKNKIKDKLYLHFQKLYTVSCKVLETPKFKNNFFFNCKLFQSKTHWNKCIWKVVALYHTHTHTHTHICIDIVKMLVITLNLMCIKKWNDEVKQKKLQNKKIKWQNKGCDLKIRIKN